MLSAGDDEVITSLSLDTNGNLSKITLFPTPQPPGGEAEDVPSLTCLGNQAKQTSQGTSTAGPSSASSKAQYLLLMRLQLAGP